MSASPRVRGTQRREAARVLVVVDLAGGVPLRQPALARPQAGLPRPSPATAHEQEDHAADEEEPQQRDDGPPRAGAVPLVVGEHGAGEHGGVDGVESHGFLPFRSHGVELGWLPSSAGGRPASSALRVLDVRNIAYAGSPPPRATAPPPAPPPRHPPAPRRSAYRRNVPGPTHHPPPWLRDARFTVPLLVIGLFGTGP